MIKPNFKKIACALMSLCLVAGSFVPVHATVDETQNIEESTTASTSVTYTQGSTFTVTIPKAITIDTNKTASYEVKVEGDIASNEVINVVPDAEVILTDENKIKTNVTGSITQTKTKWEYTEITTGNTNVGEGSIDATGLTAGNWAGTFNFNITLSDVSIITFTFISGPPYNAFPEENLGEFKAEEGMTFGEWVDSDYSKGLFEKNGSRVQVLSRTEWVISGKTENKDNVANEVIQNGITYMIVND